MTDPDDGFEQKAFDAFALDHGVVGTFQEPVPLNSGRMSLLYINWRDVCSVVQTIDTLGNFVINFVLEHDLQPDCFYGVPEGATKLGVITQYKWAKRGPNYGKRSHALPMGRGNQKKHGRIEDRFFVGPPRGKVIVLEDVTTTGYSLLNAIKNVRTVNDAEVIGAIALTNRMEYTPHEFTDERSIVERFTSLFQSVTEKLYFERMSVAKALQSAGVPYFTLSNGPTLLQKLHEQQPLSQNIRAALGAEFTTYGISPLVLS